MNPSGTDVPESRAEASGRPARSIGTYRGERAGPLLLCISSLHGNEPAGAAALVRILRTLGERGTRLRGDLVGLRGNLLALERGRRFVDEDLNRVWQRDRVATILASLRAERAAGEAERAEGKTDATPERAAGGPLPMVGSAELAEERHLLAAIRDETRKARGPVYVLDLHTTSSRSAPFTTLGDTLQNRELALRLPVPVVLGLEEQIDGAMLQYFDRLGWPGIGIEGGAHDDPDSVDAHEDAVWILLEGLGMVEADEIPDLAPRRARLRDRARSLPRIVDVRYRHEILPRDEFRMEPGYENFEPVAAGERLGTDRLGPVRAPMRGRVFLPLYQKQGDDGFFIVRRVSPAWLRLSKRLRRAGMDRFATWIPGVHPHPDRSDAVVLAPWASNRLVIGLLHLLGFNARREKNRVLMIRRHETATPDPELDPRL